MPDFAAPISRLIDELKHLPGIGQKTAQRLAFHLLRAKPEEAMALADAIRDAKQNIKFCSVCNNITDADPCFYCTSATRNHKTICVVEEPINIMAIEKTRQFGGLYHVLGGSLSPLQGIGPDQLKIKSLIERMKGRARKKLSSPQIPLPKAKPPPFIYPNCSSRSAFASRASASAFR